MCALSASFVIYQHLGRSVSFHLYSRYVLVAQPEVREPHAQATAMEETLLLLRFPKSRARRSHTRAPIPSLRSNRNLGVRTGYEM